MSHIGDDMIRAIMSIPSKYDHDDEKGEQRYIGGHQNDDNDDKHCDDDEDDDDDDYDDDDEKDDDDDDDWLCGKYLWKILGTIKKMLESRPEDALVKLVKLVNLVKLVKQWRLY